MKSSPILWQLAT